MQPCRRVVRIDGERAQRTCFRQFVATAQLIVRRELTPGGDVRRHQCKCSKKRVDSDVMLAMVAVDRCKLPQHRTCIVGMLHQQREDGVLLHPAIDLISGVLGIGEFRRGGIHRDDREV